MCRDGTWKAANDEEIHTAWEEGVRLREKMFWTRIGGGVVPAALKEAQAQMEKSRRSNDGEQPRKSGGTDTADVDADSDEDVKTPDGNAADRSKDRVVLLQAPGQRAPAVKLETPPQQITKNPFDERSGDGDEDEVDSDLTPVKEKNNQIEEAGTS